MPVLTPLPIDAVLPRVVQAAARAPVVVEAPTGAGKTTRIPPALQVDGQVLLVEPRRVAARAAARRIASERGLALRRDVGWHVRFDRHATDDTRVVAMTTGILLRRLQRDPFLEGVGAVVFDEVHERALDLDLAMAMCREVRQARPDLTLVAMSATLDAGRLAEWLEAERITSAGRSFPVDTRYLARPDDRRLELRVAEAVRAALVDADGDLLVFLPGVREIHQVARALQGLSADVVALYGDLPPDQQDRALAPGTRRRVVLATNVAESSVTVPGVRVVVDSGLVRRPWFDPHTGLEGLATQAISRASADQRAGRAGRVAPGMVWRLWTERAHQDLAPFDPPEVQRASLAGPVLRLLEQGVHPETFGWFEPPPAEALVHARAVLTDLGAVEGDTLTPIGHALLALPVHPRLARLVVEAARWGHPRGGALAAAVLSERDPFRDEGPGAPSVSDVLDRVERLAAGGPSPLVRIAQELERRARLPAAGHGDLAEALGRAVLAAWPDRVARRRVAGSPRARMVGGEGVVIGRRSAVHRPELFVCVDLGTRREGDREVRLASGVEAAWLQVEDRVVASFDPDAEAVRAERQQHYRDLVLTSHPTRCDPELAAEALAEAAATRLDRVLPRDEAFGALVQRLRSLAHWLPGEWPEVDDPVLASLVPGLCQGRRSFAELRAADWARALMDHLGWARRAGLERLAPTHLEIPSGRRAALRYQAGQPPVLAAQIQELFGTTVTPAVLDGRVPVRLELLAPNQRPAQVTDDLAGFWARTWPEVRRELRGRYPRHPWPEDPASAPPATRSGRRRR